MQGTRDLHCDIIKHLQELNKVTDIMPIIISRRTQPPFSRTILVQIV
jgi:hypothetical protein